MYHYVLVLELRVKTGQEWENKPSGALTRKPQFFRGEKSGCSQMRLCSGEVWEKSLFHFISAFPSLIVRLIKKELALDFLQMFLSKQINLCGVNIEKLLSLLLLLWTEEFIVADRYCKRFNYYLFDFRHSCHIYIALLELFGKMCWTNAGQMHRHLHHCIVSECVYAEVNALFMHLHKLLCDIIEPPQCLPLQTLRYQHASLIKLVARLSSPSQRLNFTDKVLLRSLRWCHHLW